MDKNAVLRVAAIAAVLLLVWKFVLPAAGVGGSKAEPQPLPAETYVNAPGFEGDKVDPPSEPNKPNNPQEGELCKIEGKRFDVTLSSRGAAVQHWNLEGGKYEGMDLSTTPDVERWRSLRTTFRGPDAKDQLEFDRFNWKLEDHDAKSCTFSYEDATAKVVKRFEAGERPFELNVSTTVTNLAKESKKHQLAIGVFAFRTNSQMKGSLGRQSPWETETACAGGSDVVRKNKDDFKSGWFAVPGVDRYAAVNSHFFTQALMPTQAPNAVTDLPRCEVLTEDWLAPGQARDADDAPFIFHAKLVYPTKELVPSGTATYSQTAFFGPKEREVLASAGGNGRLKDVINLGFFRWVASYLVWFLVALHDHVTFGNWGLAIIMMTVCLRTLLFPLTYKSIKTTIMMRKLKPELDIVNEKFKDDAQAKQLATMELWKKHGVNPFGGCLPQLVQMPVWFAMYTTLRTAVETYHVNFLWFKDLSSPDPFFILPLLLGAFMIVQQRIVPQQGMDPVQAKMMQWMMPVVFTVMMLFLPAALGVYMLTNSVLGIVQQLVLEKVAPRGKTTEIVVKQKDETKKSLDGGFGKGKARV
jgi:YidC/Oxa1 family membrane protein insertase